MPHKKRAVFSSTNLKADSNMYRLYHVVFNLLLLLCSSYANASLFDCERCGLISWELSKGDDCVEECVGFWMILFGYRCSECSPSTGPASTPQGPSLPTPPATPPPYPVTPPVSASSPVPPPSPVAAIPSPTSPVTDGLMTMWTGSPSAVTGGSCEFAHTASTSQGSSWLEPYVNNLRYCAVSDLLYEGGMGCGNCYEISYSGTGGTDPGRAGSATIQVVDSGSAKEFDCFLDTFSEITGASTGIFPIEYSKVPCTKSGPTVVVLDGPNAWYVKVLFAGGATGVSSARLNIGASSFAMQRVSGATWKADLSGQTNESVTFVINFSDGTTFQVTECFEGKWPVDKGTQCQ